MWHELKGQARLKSASCCGSPSIKLATRSIMGDMVLPTASKTECACTARSAAGLGHRGSRDELGSGC